MKKVFLRSGEALFVVLLALFIVFISSQDKISKEPFEKVSKEVISACDLNGLEKRDGLRFKKQFSLETENFGGFVYYSSDSVMDVRELVIISLKDMSQQDKTADSIKVYVKEKQKLFEDYAPEESEMLSSHVLIAKKGYILFYVGNETEKVAQVFEQSL